MARVLIPDTAEFLKNYAGNAYGKTIEKAPDYLGKVAGLVNYVDKLAESPGLTYLAGALSRKASEIEKGLNASVQAQKEAEMAKPKGIGGSTMGGGEVTGGADITLKDFSEEEKRAYAAMTPDERLRYMAAKKRAALTAEQTDFAASKANFDAQRAQLLAQRAAFAKTQDIGIPQEVFDKFTEDQKKEYLKLREPKNIKTMQEGLVTEVPKTEPVRPTPVQPPVFPTPGAPQPKPSNVPTETGKPVAAGAVPAAEAPQVPGQEVRGPVSPFTLPREGAAPAGSDYVKTLADLNKQIAAAKSDKERAPLLAQKADFLQRVSRDIIARGASPGTTVSPETSQTQVAGMRPAAIRPELGVPTKLGLETPDDAEVRMLAQKYGLSPESAAKFKAQRELGVTPEPGQEPFEMLDSEDKIYSAARMADTPEKQRLVLQAASNLELRPKNVYEAFGFGVDPERKAAFATTVINMFPKKTAVDMYYEQQLKQEQARLAKEKAMTEAGKRPGEVQTLETKPEVMAAQGTAAMETARGTAAKTRTEDFLRGAKLAEKIGHAAAEQKKAEAAMRAAMRPRGGGQRQDPNLQVALTVLKGIQGKAKDAYIKAADAKKKAGELWKGNEPSDAGAKKLEAEAQKKFASAITDAEKKEAADASKRAAAARAQYNKDKDKYDAAAALKAQSDQLNQQGDELSTEGAEFAGDVTDKALGPAGALQKYKKKKGESPDEPPSAPPKKGP